MTRRISTLVLLIAWLSAPAVGALGVEIRLGEPFDVHVDQTATLTGEGLDVGFTDVVSDSRCPRDAQCFWQGAAVVRLSVEKAPDRGQTFTVRVPSESATVTYGSYSVSILDLKPYPETSRPQRREDYVVTVVVTRPEKPGAKTDP